MVGPDGGECSPPSHRSRTRRSIRIALWLVALAAPGVVVAQSDGAPPPLDGTPTPPKQAAESGDGSPPVAPVWGDGEAPFGFNGYFATSDGCADCHSASEEALALRDRTGRDISPYSLWQASPHANSQRDPFYLAQLSWSRPPDPGTHDDFEASCLPCHAPMTAHTTRLDGRSSTGDSVAQAPSLRRDGVSCTVCHQVRTDQWTEDHFDGRLPIPGDRTIVGAHPEPVAGPMVEYTGFQVRPDATIRSPELCGSCHTYRNPAGLLISSSYLEWRASRAADGPTCQECHYPSAGAGRIARAPLGRDFNLPIRRAQHLHGPSGGNAYLLDLLRYNAGELGVEAPSEELQRAATGARLGLLDRTAQLTISPIQREGVELAFDVRIENRTGHKLPTGHPARRVWLMVEVRIGGQEVFVTGRFDDRGRIVGLDQPARAPHHDTVTTAEQVVIYESVPVDGAGQPTTNLSRASRFLKDNRILPRGWSGAGTAGARTMPIGVGSDPDFGPGEDVVHFRLPVLSGTRGKASIVARLMYQSVPPRWIAPHVKDDRAPSQRFARMAEATPPLPEVLGLVVRFE